MENISELIDGNHKYKKAPDDELCKLCVEFLKRCGEAKVKIWGDTIGISAPMAVIIKIVDLVRRRRLYFHVYHDTNGINEIKEAALHVFWILKLQPFCAERDALAAVGEEEYSINTKIALSFFLRGLDFYAKEMVKNANDSGKAQTCKINLNESTIQNLYHSFCFQDLSKEALMVMGESLISFEEKDIAIAGYSNLNAKGKEKLEERLQELLRLPEYTNL